MSPTLHDVYGQVLSAAKPADSPRAAVLLCDLPDGTSLIGAELPGARLVLIHSWGSDRRESTVLQTDQETIDAWYDAGPIPGVVHDWLCTIRKWRNR